MNIAFGAAIAVLALSGPADASAWHFAFNQGIAEYSVGSFADDANSLSLSCSEGGVAPGSVDVLVRRANFTPASHEPVTFTVGKRRVTMFTDTDGRVAYPSVGAAPRFRSLWQMIRTGGLIRVTFGPGAPMAFPLTGAGKLLGPVPCPRQLAR